MRGIRVWARLLGLARGVVEDVWIDDAGAVIVAARPWARERGRCGICRRRCPGYDWGEGRRRWRALDLATTRAFVQADAPRVQCRRHGVIVAAVPQRAGLPGPVSHRQVGDRRARRDPPRGLKRGPAPGQHRAGPRSEGRALCAVEEPREPHRPPAAKARLDRRDQQAPVPRLPAQRAAQADLPRRRRRSARDPRRLAEVGVAMSLGAVPKARQNDPRPARRNRGRDRQQTQQRTRRADQHADPADHSPRLRLPLTTSRDRARDAQPRRPLPTPPGPVNQPTEPAVGSEHAARQEGLNAASTARG